MAELRDEVGFGAGHRDGGPGQHPPYRHRPEACRGRCRRSHRPGGAPAHGTLQYISPEQLQGKKADARSDIFAFGCVLYEMLSGAKAFGGTNAASVIAAILEREIPPVGNQDNA